ncbi:unnamed protein product, partial [Clonostachys rosea]
RRNCATVPSHSCSLVSGKEASEGQFVSTVSLASSLNLCGGTLINSDTFITAARCVVGANNIPIKASAFTIRARSLQNGLGGITSAVSQVIPRSYYNASTPDNDLAILKVTTPIANGDTIGHAPLPASGSDPDGTVSAKYLLTALQKGLTEGSVATALPCISVPVVLHDECPSIYSNFEEAVVTDDMFYAGTGEDCKNACPGDSDGPAFGGDGTLLGVVSWRWWGCAAGFPGVYARVSSYIDWLDQHLRRERYELLKNEIFSEDISVTKLGML